MTDSMVTILVSLAGGEQESAHVRAASEVITGLGLSYTVVNGIDEGFSVHEGITAECLMHIRQELFPLFFQNGVYLGNIAQFYTACLEGNIQSFIPSLRELATVDGVDEESVTDETSSRESLYSIFGEGMTDSIPSVQYGIREDSFNWTSTDEEEY